MATIETVRFVDDLNPDVDAVHPHVELGLDGKDYELDLGEANRARLDEILAPFIAAARRVPHRGGRAQATRRRATQQPGARGPATTDREQNQAIRRWAWARNMQCSERGRIPAEVLEAYHAAPAGATATPAP